MAKFFDSMTLHWLEQFFGIDFMAWVSENVRKLEKPEPGFRVGQAHVDIVEDDLGYTYSFYWPPKERRDPEFPRQLISAVHEMGHLYSFFRSQPHQRPSLMGEPDKHHEGYAIFCEFLFAGQFAHSMPLLWHTVLARSKRHRGDAVFDALSAWRCDLSLDDALVVFFGQGVVE